LSECRTLIDNLCKGQHIHQKGDAERFKRSQYFARIGTWDWEVDTDRLYWSDAIYGMFGFKIGEVTPSYALFCACVHPDDRARVRAGELRCLETGENHDEEYRVVWPDGTLRWLRETGNVVKNEHDKTIKMMGVVRDITEEKASASYLRHLAHFDPLTGLPNRLVLEERLAEALEQARVNN
ncbi:PAS domain-containing protein, partial [Pseudomonas fluorescens]